MAKRKSKYDWERILVVLEDYVERTEIPIIAEFAYLNRIPRSMLYESPVLADAIKRLIDKKEAQLERGGLDKTIDKTMAIFSLKQLGWRDVQEIGVNDSFTEIAKGFAALVQTAGAGRVSSGDKPVSGRPD